MYLRAQIRRWDEPIWHPTRRVAELEQRLRVTATAGADLRRGERLSAEEALADTRMLVVMGGPGAGKTWLARRYARQAAERAIAALDQGVAVEAVELPLLTTWDHWAQSSGRGLREGLVAAALSRGVDDLGGAPVTGRLRRLLTRPGARVLVVVDSLDEFADHPAQGGQWTRLRDLASLSADWRVVVTSRYGAWTASNRGLEGQVREVEIEPLAYPKDVTSFVSSWFLDQPHRAQRLLAQIEARAELRGTAVVPLLLTFYCLLAGDGEIPRRRRELYTRLVDQLLSASWVDDQPHVPDRKYCQRLLAGWAWRAVAEPSPPPGWATGRLVRPTHRTALGPEQGDRSRGPPNRGRHRREHHAALRAPHAAGTLRRREGRRHGHQDGSGSALPHLWFDADWELAAPAAISAHPDRSQLLVCLLPPAFSSPDRAKTPVGRETDRLLLRIGAESLPADWDQTCRALIHLARVRGPSEEPSLLAATSQWADSSGEALTGLLAALPAAQPSAAARLVGAVVSLGASEELREQALTGLLAALPAAQPSAAARLVGAVVSLGASQEQRGEVLARLLALLPNSDWFAEVADLTDAAVSLAQSEEQRSEVLAGLLAALPTADGSRRPAWWRRWCRWERPRNSGVRFWPGCWPYCATRKCSTTWLT